LIPDSVSEATKGIQISAFKPNEEDRAALQIVLINLVTDTVDYFGGMETSQVNMVISTIKAKYWFMKIDEIAMVFNRARMGMVKTYGKVKPVDMLAWLHEYDIGERLSYCEAEATKHKETSGTYFIEAESIDRKKDAIQLSQAIGKEKNWQKAKEIVETEAYNQKLVEQSKKQ